MGGGRSISEAVCGQHRRPRYVIASACMTDDKTKTWPQDAQRVNVNEAYEIEYWTKHFKCTPERLRAAVKKLGVMVKDIENELKGK
jgi:Protein of unknown function (DUF3606)